MSITLEELKSEVNWMIEEVAKERGRDFEALHIQEDFLYKTVLWEIARGCSSGQELAQEVLRLSTLEDFIHWSA